MRVQATANSASVCLGIRALEHATDVQTMKFRHPLRNQFYVAGCNFLSRTLHACLNTHYTTSRNQLPFFQF